MLLHTHSTFSLRYGTLTEEEVLRTAAERGFTAVALTDINNTSACFNFLRLAPQYNIHAVVGVDFRNGNQTCFVALARNHDGFAEINTLLTHHLHSGKPLPERAPQHWQHTVVIYPFRKDRFCALLNHEYIGVPPAHMALVARSPWRNEPHKLVALATATFRNKADYNTHRLLRAIDHNTLLSKLPADAVAPTAHAWSTPAQLVHACAAYPALLTRATELLESCQFHYTFGVPQNKQQFTPSVAEDLELLRANALVGLHRRYPRVDAALRQRMDNELQLITEKGFVPYFLIAWDIVEYANRKGYYHVGRGSGANSLVAYALGITDVDPVDLDLYFERFINLYRENPPDFDIDFSWRDREDVTRYIFERHGTAQTALLGAYNTFQLRATQRELGKVFGLPKAEIDALVLRQTPPDTADSIHQLVLKYSARLQNFPNHLSIHAGGILISQAPITRYSATHMPPKGFPTVQFDMVVAEDIGLYKYDILSQRGLGHIRDTLDIVRHNRHQEADVRNIPQLKSDPGVRQLLREGRAIGCFYVESPAMRQLLEKLQCDDYPTLVAASSIIRPGVASSGMMRAYIERFRMPEKRAEAHPVLMEILPETFGVMVYQEDVIRVAHLYAGMTLAEADVLRRGMSGKYRSREEFQRVRDTFFANCTARGIPPDESAEVWRQIESFAGYSFAKGHSASYAVESFQSLYLKAHYPLEFMVGVINNFGGFYSTEVYVHEARMAGADIQPPCINHSGVETRIAGKTIYLGLGLVQSLEARTVELLLQARAHGAFASLADLADRVPLSLEQTKLLIQVGALRCTGKTKKELYWEAHLLLGSTPRPTHTAPLFPAKPTTYTLPELNHLPLQDAYDALELLGFPLCNPFDLVDADLSRYPLRARHLAEHLGQTVVVAGYLVTTKPTRTRSGERMGFGTFLDADGHWLDTTHFPAVYRHYPFRGRAVYLITGTVDDDFGVKTITVQHMERLPVKQLEKVKALS